MIAHQYKRGFTLIELLVVIAIIGLLSAVVFTSLAAARQRALNASYVAQLKEYQKALALYYAEHGTYPGNSTRWGCIGTGYTNGVCWDNANFNESNATANAFRDALSPYMDATKPTSPTNRIFGSMYRRPPGYEGYQMILMLEGDVSCPIGKKATHAASAAQNLTRCNLNSQGL